MHPVIDASIVTDWRIHRDEAGFTLAEFLISSFVFLVISAAVFSLLAETQRAASYQSEVQAVLDNMRIAMQIVEQHIREAGNDPLGIGLAGINVVSSTEVQIKSDLTGSAGPSDPDKGDPDGDTNDSGEDVTIRYNASAQTIEIVPNGGSAQAIAGYISAFSLQYYDTNGNATTVGNDVRKITVSISGSSPIPNPQTHRIFGAQLVSDLQIATRQ